MLPQQDIQHILTDNFTKSYLNKNHAMTLPLVGQSIRLQNRYNKYERWINHQKKYTNQPTTLHDIRLITAKEYIRHYIHKSTTTPCPDYFTASCEKSWNIPKKERKILHPASENTLEKYSAYGEQERQNTLKSRIESEIDWCEDNDWLTIMVLLTVEESHLEGVFTPNSDRWRRFCARLDYTMGGRKHYHYLAVLELGKLNGRQHIHMLLHLHPKLASKITDPALFQRHHTEIDLLKGIWPHGFCNGHLVRSKPMDAAGRSGYLWPMDATGNPHKQQNTGKVANYIAKYHTKQRAGGLKWRIRLTKNYGTQRTDQIINTHKKVIEILIRNHGKILHQRIHPKKTAPSNLWMKMRTIQVLTKWIKIPMNECGEHKTLWQLEYLYNIWQEPMKESLWTMIKKINLTESKTENTQTKNQTSASSTHIAIKEALSENVAFQQRTHKLTTLYETWRDQMVDNLIPLCHT